MGKVWRYVTSNIRLGAHIAYTQERMLYIVTTKTKSCCGEHLIVPCQTAQGPPTTFLSMPSYSRPPCPRLFTTALMVKRPER